MSRPLPTSQQPRCPEKFISIPSHIVYVHLVPHTSLVSLSGCFLCARHCVKNWRGPPCSGCEPQGGRLQQSCHLFPKCVLPWTGGCFMAGTVCFISMQKDLGHTLEIPLNGPGRTLSHTSYLMVKRLSLKEAPYHTQVFIPLSCI